MSKKILFFVLVSFLAPFYFAKAEIENDREDYVPATTQTTVSTPSSSDTSSKAKTYKETIVVTPAQIVTENQVQTISLPDQDNDGIPDSEDPHPDIAEIYIVKDDNLNGIVDTFEYGN